MCIRDRRCLSRKYENLKKGESTQRANIQKQKLKVQKLHHKIDNIRTDYINKTIAEIVKTKPSYITIEDLNVSGMMKDVYKRQVWECNRGFLYERMPCRVSGGMGAWKEDSGH